MNKPYTNTNRLTFDERGVSEVIGSILVFGIVVMLLSIVQTQAIPNANEEVEFEHSQMAQEDLSRLHSSISRSALQGESGTVSVKLGTTYPTRLMFYNPPSATGQLSTSNPGQVTLSNVEATDQETADYLDSSRSDFPIFKTRYLSYSANYNHYQNAPETIIEGTRVAKNHRNTVRVANPGQLVSGNRISLVLLSGDVSEGGVSAESFSATPVSGPASPVTVTNTDSQEFTVEVPTQIPEETWVTDLLADEIDDSGDANPGLEEDDTDCSDIQPGDSAPNRYVVGCEYNDGTITLHFEQNTNYQLQMSEVNLGEHPKSTQAKYVVPSGKSTIVTAQGTSAQFSVKVRDKYNNPVAGVPVTFDLPDGSQITVSSGPTGRAIGTWSPPELGNYDITAEINGGDQAYENTELTVSSISPSRTPINPSNGVVLKNTGQGSCGGLLGIGETCHAIANFENNDDVSHTFTSVRVSVYADVDGQDGPPDKVVVGTNDDDVTLDVGGEAKTFDSTIGSSGTKEFQFEFKKDGTYNAETGDFFVFDVAFENGESATYFIPVTET